MSDPKLPKAELNTRGLLCSQCGSDFRNGDLVLLVDCGNDTKHLFCKVCSDSRGGLIGHLIHGSDMGSDESFCSICKSNFRCMTFFLAGNYYPGKGTGASPIKID